MSTVELYVYDLSKGLARLYAPMLDLNIDGVWHSAIVVHGREIYFGQGINMFEAGKTHLGPPERKINLGRTELPWEVIEEFIADCSESWTADKYHLLQKNCNHFSKMFADFLNGREIPKYILDTAEIVAASPFGQMLTAGLALKSGGGIWVP